MTLAIDYAWAHPNPAAIKADGYSAVMRYLSHDPSKDLTAGEAAALHAAGLSIGLVFETTARRAADGFGAGSADCHEAEQRASALGYPASAPIFYAVDYDAEPGSVSGYFDGILKVASRPVGVYGSYRVVEYMRGHSPGVSGLRVRASYGWQATAWSYDVEQHRVLVSNHAHLFQRIKRTLGPLAGVKDSAWDEDAILAPLPLWAPGARVEPPSRSTTRPPVKPPVVHKPPAPVHKPLLVVDGKMGAHTVAAMQTVLKVKADGVFGLHTAEALQRHVGVIADGDVGPLTVKALQRHVRAHVDGIWPSVARPHTPIPVAVSDTTRHIQSAINGHAF